MRYRTGTRDRAIALMARYAIRDQEAYIEAIEGCTGDSFDDSRKHAEDCIADFKHILRTLKR